MEEEVERRARRGRARDNLISGVVEGREGQGGRRRKERWKVD